MFLACTKVELLGPDSLYCGKWGKFFNAYSDLDLDPTKLNFELVQSIFIYYKVFQFRVPGSISFRVIVQTHTHTQRDSNEYPIVAFSKNATIIKCTGITLRRYVHVHVHESQVH